MGLNRSHFRDQNNYLPPGRLYKNVGFIGSQPPFVAAQPIRCALTVKNPTTVTRTYAILLSFEASILGALDGSLTPINIVMGDFPEITLLAGETQATSPLSFLAPPGTQVGAGGGTTLPITWNILADVEADGQTLPQIQVGTVVVGPDYNLHSGYIRLSMMFVWQPNYPLGTIITAKINGMVVASTIVTMRGSCVLDVPGSDGDLITVYADGRQLSGRYSTPQNQAEVNFGSIPFVSGTYAIVIIPD